jgi:hypothetical protein
MKKRLSTLLPFLLLLLFLALRTFSSGQSFVQIGLSIDGIQTNEQCGTSVAMNSSGDIVIVGSPQYSVETTTKCGRARIFQLVNGNWVEMNASIIGTGHNDHLGGAVAINGDGTIVAVGAAFRSGDVTFSSYVNVYKYHQNTNAWQQMTGIAVPAGTFHTFGTSVSLNEEGDVLAVGAPGWMNLYSYSGKVVTYKWNESTGQWSAIDDIILGVAALEFFGYSVSLNNTGNMLAVGAPQFDVSSGYLKNGLVRVYEFANDKWQQKNNDIPGPEGGSEFGYDVAFNGAGNRLIVGAPKCDGHGKSYIYPIGNTYWNTIIIDGINVGDRFGCSVDINDQGQRVFVGAFASSGSGAASGSVEIYDLNLLGSTHLGSIGGETAGDNNGWSIAVNSTGDKVITGSPAYSPAGQARVFGYYDGAIWSGKSDTDWFSSENWEQNEVPTESSNVLIPAEPDNQPIIIFSEKQFASFKNLYIYPNASLTLQPGASLLNFGNIDNQGTMHVQLSVNDGRWHLISIPTTEAMAGIFQGDYLQQWNEPTASWSEIIPVNTPLTPGQGYSLWGVAKNTTYTFSGNVNTGNLDVEVSHTPSAPGSNKGANLLGNPYPSAIDWSLLDETWGAVYYYDGNAYTSWVNNQGAGTQFIPPCQGFFIIAQKQGKATFTFSDNIRVHNNIQLHKTETTNAPTLVLQTNSLDWSDKLFISQNPEATAGFDLQHDAYKILTSTTGLSHLWSVTGAEQLSIDVRPQWDVVQLGFRNTQNSICNISISQSNGFNKAILEDTRENIFHDLTKGIYEFVYDITDCETRFKLHLNVVGVGDIPSGVDNILIYAAGQQIFIKGAEGGIVIVADIAGRMVLTETITSSELTTLTTHLNNGVYVVRVQNNKNLTTEKIIINGM